MAPCPCVSKRTQWLTCTNSRQSCAPFLGHSVKDMNITIDSLLIFPEISTRMRWQTQTTQRNKEQDKPG